MGPSKDEGKFIYAPWSRDQVTSLNMYQRSRTLHPYTCGKDHDGRRDLLATENGWVCVECDYVQDWAWRWSTDWSWFNMAGSLREAVDG